MRDDFVLYELIYLSIDFFLMDLGVSILFYVYRCLILGDYSVSYGVRCS